MSSYTFPFKEVETMLETADTVTIITHLNPDADTLGTGLGIYHLLRSIGKKVEIVNFSKSLPHTLKFLPNFHRIKSKMEFEESLIITCDCGSLSRLGTTLKEREILNIDHHKSNTLYGTLNIVDARSVSASQVAYRLLQNIYTISQESALCFYTALLSDSSYFTASAVNQEVFCVAQELIALGVNPAEVALHLTQKRSLSALRILEKALSHLTLLQEAKVALLWVSKQEMLETGATMADTESIVEYARSLATVEIGIFMIEFDEGIRLSLRSKKVDVSTIALMLGGGGHPLSSGAILKNLSLEESQEIILDAIIHTGVLNEKKK